MPRVRKCEGVSVEKILSFQTLGNFLIFFFLGSFAFHLCSPVLKK